MRPFIREMSAFAGIQMLLAGVFFGFFYRTDGGTAGALSTKYSILESTPPPRLVLVGGSNVWYGIDSPLLEHELGIRTVNMGICAPTTLDFQLAITRSRLRNGDVVVVSPEYHSWWLRYGDRPDNDLILQIVEQTPEALLYLDWNQTKTALDRLILGRLGYMFRKSVDAAIGRDGEPIEREFMNDHGDFIAHRRRPWPGGFPQNPLRNMPDEARVDRTVRSMNRFHDFCTEKGIRVFLSYPPLPEDYFEASSKVISVVRSQVEESVTIPFLDDPRSMTQPESRFYDSPYHPMFKGTLERTKALAESLREALDLHVSPQSLWLCRPGETVFLSDKRSEYYLLDGWRQFEPNGRRSMSANAEIQFDLEVVMDAHFELQWRTLGNPPTDAIDVFLNERPLVTLTGPGADETVSLFEMPSDRLGTHNLLTFTRSGEDATELAVEVDWFRTVIRSRSE